MKGLLNNKLVWLGVAIVVVVGLVLAFKGDNNSGSSSSGSSSVSVNKEVQDKCMGQINDATFCKFAGSFANVKSYKIDATVKSSTGTQTLQMSKDASGNSSMTVSTGGQTQTIVQYNGETYAKDPTDNQWIKYPKGSASSPQITDPVAEIVKGDFNKNSQGNQITYKNVGTEACGALTCYKYQITEVTTTPQSGYMWFDTKDYLLRQISISSAGTTTDMTVSYNNVSVSQPSPVKN